MSLIRYIEIKNFRGIQNLAWRPGSGINCIIGSGDSGKSSIIDAIDICIGGKRNISDCDFYNLNFESQISIKITLGSLPDELLNIDQYGLYLRGFDINSGVLYDEPSSELETVITIETIIDESLELQRYLTSDRASDQGLKRNLAWADRSKLIPTRLGGNNDQHFSWRKGSILHKLSEEKVDHSKALLQVGREARAGFGSKTDKELAETLETVQRAATKLGVPVKEAQALMDANAVSLNGGMISLHDEKGVPLSALGLGSGRLLVAGLQKEASAEGSILLVDELEHGLEPHRIIRFLNALGAKDKFPSLQVFAASHSPVVIRELNGSQLFVLRKKLKFHEVVSVGVKDNIQAAIRKYPEAILAPSIIVCEGATEVGLLRGLDHFRVQSEETSLMANGIALVDGGGSEMFERALSFQELGYRTAVFRDSDVFPTPALEMTFRQNGGSVFSWKEEWATEDAIFSCLPDQSISELLDLAIEYKSEELVSSQITTASEGKLKLSDIQMKFLFDELTDYEKEILSTASRSSRARQSWFKSVSAMERAGHEIIAPVLEDTGNDFKNVLESIFDWCQT